ncbi:titin-like isoform X2 [Seriola aureovittata]|uniref:titin-like isoform X2 n=1 Tax=Seriola aureovittata TaxID=2871759 RepID=UPI0024BE4580|nr:titin-like isoform X2 [Seriola aureovittata]
MGHTLLCALSLFLLPLLYCGQAEDAALTLEPRSSYLFTGESVTFICDMNERNDTDWYYKFTWNGQQIVSFNSRKSYSLELTEDLSGDYQCIGRHEGSTNLTKHSNKVILSVSALRPTATLRADRTSIPAGGTLTLTCSVEGSGDWKYDWFTRNPDSHETKMVTEGVQNSVSVSHEGIYRCRGRRGNPVFFTKHSDMHRIEKTLPIKTYVTLTYNWTQIYSGEMIIVRCEIQGGGDTDWEYEWRTTSSNAPPTHSEYRLSSASASYSGDYWCKARRDLYSSTEWSQAFTLTVSSHKPRPTVMADKRTLPVNGNVTLTCSVENSAEWKYDWFRRTSHSSEAQAIRAGEPGKVISISHGGIYHCRGGRRDTAFSTENSESVTIEKTVSNKAVVFLQPNWPLVFTGETITIRCGIHGGGSTEWEYEWSKPKSSTVSAYDEYRIDSASVSDSGNYRCKGKDKRDLFSSTEWSDVITLTVSADRPTANLSADNRAFAAGGRVTLTCSVNPSSSGWKYYWYTGEKTSEPLTTQDAASHSSGEVSVSQEGLYWCRGGRGDPVYYTEFSDPVNIHKTVSNRAVVTVQPNWPEIYRGETITLRCEIQGGDTEWTYEWMTTSSYKLSNNNEERIRLSSSSQSGDYYWCKGRLKSAQQNSTAWSVPFKFTVSYTSQPVLTVSPSWLSPGASVTLKCEVKHPSAGWRFYWYKAVPRLSKINMYNRYHSVRGRWIDFDYYNSYSYELLPGSSSGTEQDSYIVHGQTHTAGYVCKAGRGDPVIYTETSKLKFVWSGDVHPAASLTVSPGGAQHFTSDSVSLSCEGNSTEWRVKRFPDDSSLPYSSYCSTTRTGSTCNVHGLLPRNDAYWCESGSGQFSNAVNITASYSVIILVSPVHPVNEGDSVSLHCKLRPGLSFYSNFAFYKNGNVIHNDDSGVLNISAVSKSDEGFYKCEHSGNESPESWMSVKSSRSSSPEPLVVGLVSGVALVVLLLLLLLCWCRKSKNPCCNRPVQSEKIDQGSATDQTVNRDANQQQIYSSLLHGDVCVYESIRGSENTGNGNRDDPVDRSDYYNVNPDAAAGP